MIRPAVKSAWNAGLTLRLTTQPPLHCSRAADADDRHVSPRIDSQTEMAIGEEISARAEADGQPDIHFARSGVTA
jgi:hypothetical protein